MADLNPRHEAFCQAYALAPSGAAAARQAGYAPPNAAHQAGELMARADVTERLAELGAERAAARAEEIAQLLAKLEPIYTAGLEAGDVDAVLQVVELQARISGLVQGGATVRPRSARTPSSGVGDHEAALAALDYFDEAAGEITPINPHETPG